MPVLRKIISVGQTEPQDVTSHNSCVLGKGRFERRFSACPTRGRQTERVRHFFDFLAKVALNVRDDEEGIEQEDEGEV